MRVLSFTETRIRDLPLGSGIWRDQQIKGLLVICHKTSKTYAVQGDVRRNGRFIRTVRIKIERCDRLSLKEARLKGMALMMQIANRIEIPAWNSLQSALKLAYVLSQQVEIAVRTFKSGKPSPINTIRLAMLKNDLKTEEDSDE